MKLFGSDKSDEKRELIATTEKIRKHRSIYRRKEPQKTLLDSCENLILKEWMYLDDLPKELANTVANIYYAYCELTFLMAASKNGDISQSQMLRELGIDGIEDDFVMSVAKVLPTYQAKVMGDYETINEMINNLRQIDQEYGRDSDEYQAGADFALLTMKYNIDANALRMKKAKVIKRQFDKNIIDEIPNLVDFLGV